MATNNQHQINYTNAQFAKQYQALPQSNDGSYKILSPVHEQRQHQTPQVNDVAATTPQVAPASVAAGYSTQYALQQVQNSTLQYHALPQSNDDNYQILPPIYEQRQHQEPHVNAVAATTPQVATGYSTQYALQQVQNSTLHPQCVLPQTQYTVVQPQPQYNYQLAQPIVQQAVAPKIACVPLSNQLNQQVVCPPLCVPSNQGLPIYDKACNNYQGSNCASPCNSRCNSPCEPSCYSPCNGCNHGYGHGYSPCSTPPPIGEPKTYTFLTPLNINLPSEYYPKDYSNVYQLPPEYYAEDYSNVYQLPPVHVPRRCRSLPRFAPTVLPTIYRPHHCKKQAEIVDDFVEVLENEHYFPTWKKSRNKNNELWDDYFDALKRTKRGPHDHLINYDNFYDFHEKKSKNKSHKHNKPVFNDKNNIKTKESVSEISTHSKLRDTITRINLGEKYSSRERSTVSDYSSQKQRSPKTRSPEVKPFISNYSANFKSPSYY